MDVFSQNPLRVGFGPNIQLNNRENNKYFSPIYADSFKRTSPVLLCDEEVINELISKNPEVKKILSQHKLPVKLNMEELHEIMNGHAKETAEISASIAQNLPRALKQNVDMKALKEGAMMHDFGKVLIPKEILNKPAKLNENEHKIMNLHTELGYQLLKNSGLDEKILRMVQYHHNPYETKPDINLQILNLADKYSALTENRVYKKAYTPKQALMILYSEVKEGEINPLIFNALVQTVRAKEAIAAELTL